jgi:hypothetical protein
MVPPLVALVCLVLAFFVCSDLLHRRKAQSIPRKILSILTTLFGLALISGIILAKVGLTFGVELTWKSWVFIPALGAFGLFCFAYVILVFLTTEINRELAGGVLVFAVISILLTFYYVASFAAHTYQEIPWATGGGRPSQVELIVTPEQKPFLERAGFTFSGGQNKTDSLKLLLTTEKDYILISPSGNAVSIPGDSVKSVIYAK